MIDYVIIGKRIREFRLKRGLTQAALAERSGIEPSNISHIERAATKLSLPTLVSIANALDATLDELVYNNLNSSAHVSVGIIDELLCDCTPAEIASITELIRATKAVLRASK